MTGKIRVVDSQGGGATPAATFDRWRVNRMDIERVKSAMKSISEELPYE